MDFFTLRLHKNQIAIISGALIEQPYRIVAQVLDDISNQVNKQNNEEATNPIEPENKPD